MCTLVVSFALAHLPTIPAELGVNKTWTGFMIYDDETSEGRAKGCLFVGVIASHKDGYSFIVVPPKRQDIPRNKVQAS